nr:hypothetical protein [Tanacetum cinerariifolium]
MQKVWILVDLPYGKRAIGTKWVFGNKKDERGIVVRNKARLITQGHTQEEGINYEEFFAPVARIEAVRLFLAYASFMGFMVYQMDVKSAFLYGTIEEEVYVCQPLGFEEPNHPDKVYKVVKALYGLHQAPRAWKFGLQEGKSASTPIDTEKPLLKDLNGEDVDVHTYRSMIGSLMYLTSSRPDIMFVVCACERFQVTPKASHLYAVKRIFRYLKGKQRLGLWYPKDSPFDFVAYSNSEYAGASMDRKSTTGGCQFLRCILISWQCKKQTVVATLSTEAEYVVAASCCAQVLWIQNQLMDYGQRRINHKDFQNCLFACFLSQMEPKKKQVGRKRYSDQEQSKASISGAYIGRKNRLWGISILLTVGIPSTGSGKLYSQWELSSSSGNAFDSPLLGVNTPRSDEDMLELMELTVFWLPKVNDVTRWQALIDKKKVVVMVATIREALRLDDEEEGVDCLPNEEIFTELARMGYEKPSTKLAFYKAFFSSQWKFLIHTILQCMSAKRTSWNEFSSSMASVVICLSSGDLSTHTTKYTSPYLTQKVFANMRRVGKGFSGVVTPLFESMLLEQQVDKEGDENENDETVNAGDADEGDVSAAHGEVPTVDEEPSIPSPTPPTPPPQPPQDIPSTSQWKRRVTKLERRNTVRKLKLRRLQRVGTSQRVETSDETVLDDVSNQRRMIAEVDVDTDVVLEDVKEVSNEAKEVAEDAKEDETEPAEVQKVVDVVTTAKLITKVVTAASETITVANAIITAAEAQVSAATTAVTLTAAPARVVAASSRRRKGVVIRDPEEESTTSIIIPAETKSKDKGKEILDIDWDEVIDHVKLKAKEDPAVKKYQALKRKSQTEAQARKNMMLYLKNVVGFKMDNFKGMSYDDIRLIFEAKFNSNVAFLLKTKEQIEEDKNRALQKINETQAERAAKKRKLDKELEELKRHLQIVPNEDDDVYTEATPLARKVPVVDYHIIHMNNKPYYKIIRADDTHQLYISFLTLLRNFDREDLEALWSLIKERFSTIKPKNFSDDFLLVTLGAMFEKPDIYAQIWKNQSTVHGPTKVKGWKLLESCGVQIITFTSTQLILLVEKKYPLTRFTLDQILNAIRLKVEEESEVSLKLLRFTRQQHQEGQLE